MTWADRIEFWQLDQIVMQDRRVIRLYHNDMSVCAQKVRFALGERRRFSVRKAAI